MSLLNYFAVESLSNDLLDTAKKRQAIMRFTLIPVFMAVLALVCLPTVSTATGLDSYLILAEEAETKQDQEKDENESTGDEEPECE